MVSDAVSLGELYKSKRSELNFTIKEVESATSIRCAYIEAIEEGNGHEMLSSVYMQGFMRQYAIFLGLDPEQLANEYVEAFSSKKEEEPKKDYVYGLGSIEMRAGTLSNSLWKSILKSGNVVLGVAFITVFTAAFLLIKLLGIF